MGDEPVLVDSSFYIRSMRNGRDPLQALAGTAVERDLAVCGVIRVEVGRALRRSEIRLKFKAAWDLMLDLPTDERLWEDVEETAWELDRCGRLLPVADLVIGCCAQRAGAVVLTLDRHFQWIPGLRTCSAPR